MQLDDYAEITYEVKDNRKRHGRHSSCARRRGLSWFQRREHPECEPGNKAVPAGEGRIPRCIVSAI